jgi:hypothetical protein
MFVIPPSLLQESYFKDVAETTWEVAQKDNKSKCDELKCEHKTLVISCKVELEEGGISTFHLHYRYFKGTLYCFVEESYEAPDEGRAKIESPSPSDTSVVVDT